MRDVDDSLLHKCTKIRDWPESRQRGIFLQLRANTQLVYGVGCIGAVLSGVLDGMRIRTTWIFGLAIGAAACASDRSLAPPGTVLTDAQVSADVAATAGLAAAGSIEDQGLYLDNAGVSPSVGTFARLGNISTGMPTPNADNSAPVSAAATRPNCSYSASAGFWACTPFVNSRGLTVIWSYGYFDGSGNAMQYFNSLTTERIEYKARSYGPVGDGITIAGMTHRTSEQTLSGLLGKETTRVWNGAGVSADTTNYEDGSGSRHYAGIEIDSVKRVVYAQPRTRGSYPLSGEVIRVAKYSVSSVGKSTETRSVSRTIVTTFNGTAAVPIRLGRMSCTLHLDTRKVDGCSSH